MFLFRLFFLLIFSIQIAFAAPKVGETVSERIDFGSNKSISLPKGNWQLINKDNIGGVNSFFDSYLFENTDINSSTPYVAVVFGSTGNYWNRGPTSLYEFGEFLRDDYKTINNLSSKISAFYSIDKKGDVFSANASLKRYRSLFKSIVFEKLVKDDSILSDIRFIGSTDAVFVFTAIKLPSNIESKKLAEDFKSKNLNATHLKLQEWTSKYISSIEKSYFSKFPQEPIVADIFSESNENIKLAQNNIPSTSAITTVVANENLKQEQEKLAQEKITLDAQAKLKEQERLALQAQESEKQRLTLLAQQKDKERLDQIAKMKEQERIDQIAKAKEQERLDQVAKAKEQERIAIENQKREKDRLDQLAKAKEQEKLTLINSTALSSQLEIEKLKAEAELLKLQLALATQKANEKQEPIPTRAYSNRKALVIGNDKYRKIKPLDNAVEDAKAIANNLSDVGYQVSLRTNLNQSEMKLAIRNFKALVQGGDEVLFFFAGHGVQLGSSNFLLPTDILGENEEEVKDEAIALQKILDDMNEKKAVFTLAVIDACRDNPFRVAGRAIGGRGLAPTSAASGQMIIFSAGVGQQALDKLGPSDKSKNGLFTRIFLEEMQKPGVPVDRIMKAVRSRVVSTARSINHDQVPAIYDQVVGDYYFKY